MSKLPFTVARDATFRRPDDEYFSADAPRRAVVHVTPDRFDESGALDFAVNAVLLILFGAVMLGVGIGLGVLYR